MHCLIFNYVLYPYISWEHLEHVVNHHDNRVGHLLHFVGLQVSQLISQKSQVYHCLWRLCCLQFSDEFVEVASDLPHQVLGGLNIDMHTQDFSLIEKLISIITV